VSGDGGGGEVQGLSVAGGVDEGGDDVGDQVGLVAVDELAGGVGDDVVGVEPADPVTLVALPELVDLGEGEGLSPPVLCLRRVPFPSAVGGRHDDGAASPGGMTRASSAKLDVHANRR
jgi:hypothetical protein